MTDQQAPKRCIECEHYSHSYCHRYTQKIKEGITQECSIHTFIQEDYERRTRDRK